MKTSEKKKKHICMIAYTNYSTDARVRREAETLASLPEYEVTVFSLKQNTSPRTYFLEGVEVRELNQTKYRGNNNINYLMYYLQFLLRAFFACNRLLIKNSLDIVHIHNMPNYLVFSAILPYLFGKRIILDIHDTVLETYLTKFDKNANKILFKILRLEEKISSAFAHKIICVNHVQRDKMVERGITASKIEISLNVPDPKWFTPETNGNINKKNESRKFRMVYHGTIAKRLGIDITIQAVARLIEEIPSLEFHIIGTGEDVEEFNELSKSLGLEKYVFFEKFVPLESLVAILDGMHLGIIANRKNMATELMLPVKMLEYIALNIPVVAPRLKAIQYYFTDDMVSYFEPENINSLCSVILELYKNEEKRTKQAQNAKKFLKKYGWETHKWGLINMYNQL
jgi:glycosyltransferase involved in cell wall biosynthesis